MQSIKSALSGPTWEGVVTDAYHQAQSERRPIMGINQPGARKNKDGTTTVQMASRHDQLESIAEEFEKTLGLTQMEQTISAGRQHQLRGYCEQLRIIADEVRSLSSPKSK